MPQEFYNKDVETVADILKSDLIFGLQDSEAQSRLLKYGLNELPQEERTPLWKMFLEQFNDILVRILLIAAIISAILGLTESKEFSIDAFVEPFVIMVVLIVNACISVKQSKNAEDAIEALKEYEPNMGKVIRHKTKTDKNENNTTVRPVKASILVPGDLVEICVGDRIPADIRVTQIFSSCFQVDQSILTGECMSINKITEKVDKKKVVNQDKINIIFSGTNVVKGKARGIVIGTALKTEIGKIRDQISSTENERTPLQIKLDEFGNQLSKIISVICVVVWVINIGHFGDPIHGGSWIKGAVYYFKIAIALAVAAIPEGLPAVITTCLAVGTRRMAKKNAIVRSLPSVETLGCVSVICSDKTGTLTTNQMSVMKFFVADPKSSDYIDFHCSGSTYDPKDGKITVGKSTTLDPKAYPVLKELTNVALLCNDAGLNFNKEKKLVERIGEATEAALLTFGEKLNAYQIPSTGAIRSVTVSRQHVKSLYNTVSTLEFSRTRKSMGVYVVENQGPNSGKAQIFVKGAPESVIDRCEYIRVGVKKQPLTMEMKQKIIERVTKYGTGADTLRCLALATVEDPLPESKISFSDSSKFAEYESKMTLLGVVGMIDPPRPEVSDAIKQCKKAGIRVIMITGDNKNTAEAICRRIGILEPDEDSTDIAFSATEFDQLTPEKQAEVCKYARLFARVEPAHKSKIVSYLQKAGEITAMTGDGVNDAPALKKAEIGVAMGSGTAVAKSASDMVLADDNFSSIVAAVAEGRAICANTIQFISYLVSSNIGEVLSIFFTSIFCLPGGLIPVQLLWVNLITDGLPATALGFNPPEPDIMLQKPRDPKEPLISRWQMFCYTLIGTYVGFATIGASVWWYLYDPEGPHITWNHLVNHQKCSPSNPLYAGIDCDAIFKHFVPMSMALSVLVVIEMLNACNSVSENQSIFVFPPTKNMLLVGAVITSIIIHLLTLYFPFTQRIFNVTMLNCLQWKVVLMFSFPVLLMEEALKFYHRNFIYSEKHYSKTKLKRN